jgi:Zn-dependent M28 family amino/carboxypeptidase
MIALLRIGLVLAGLIGFQMGARTLHGEEKGKRATRAETPVNSAGSFNGNRAFEDMKRLVDIGPRPSGSSAMMAAQKYIEDRLRLEGVQLETDPFVAATPRGAISMKNIIAKIPGTSSDVIIISGHYDTKLFDNISFLGANDGGSSAAFVLEMARVLKHRKSRFTYWLVFFDGEEAVGEWSDTDSVYGSRHMVERLRKSGQLSLVRAMILVDMIGDRDLDILKEKSSTSWLVDILWNSAAELGYQKYFLPKSFEIGGDDHFPFLRAGIPAVDIIDFDYGFANMNWHTDRDTIDKCSPQSLKVVGETVLRALPRIEFRLDRK